GKIKDWEVETAARSVVEADGLTSTSLKKGDRIMVQGDQASDGTEHMLARSMTLADNRSVSINQPQQPASPAPSVSSSAAPNESNPALPKTASNLPLVGLFGVVSIVAAVFLSLKRRLS